MEIKSDKAWVICEQCDIAHRVGVECPLCKLRRILFDAFGLTDLPPEAFNSTLDILIASQGKSSNN